MCRGIGAVFMQQGHPNVFYSKALGFSTYEKEFLAIVMAVTKLVLLSSWLSLCYSHRPVEHQVFHGTTAHNLAPTTMVIKTPKF